MDAKIGPTDRDFITALARGLEVLQVCGTSESGLSLAQLAQRAGLSRGTARRFLLTLGALGYVESDGRLYHLTPKVLALGNAYLGSTPLPRVSRPFLERISRQLNASCSLSILDGAEIVYVSRVQTGRIMAVDLGVGSRLPAAATAMGRVLLAALPAEDLQQWLRDTPLVSYTERTVVNPDAFTALIGGVARQGYCIVDQELEPGLRSIAVPVRCASGSVTAALNIGAQAARISLAELEESCLPVLRTAAAEMRELLIG
ncbi:transcriptional regulator [Aliidongia dinghuensis]|uniref:Transcriptional regulator n=1 Tax=Aliidongia dinghuensis TaxID=1867774 RepID=A0A8J2YP95_9PROT|nr:IclR family transcriptional regulator C-terminal domain-containing protein [Aliidongia dinghuensis]GGE99461.1 transcriptional regulator [Aliidongia dinghuensis]